MDTRQLAAFCAVVERRSFSQAADRLGVTQPAVSLQVRALEKRLGTQLLDRSGRRVEPTEAGWRLYRGAQRMLALEDQLVADVAASGQGALAGDLVLGASTGPAAVAIPVALAEFQRQNPDVRVRLFEAGAAKLLTMIEHGELHFAVTLALGHDHLAKQLLPAVQLLTLTAPRSPYGGHGRVEVGSLRDVPLLVMPPGYATRETFDAACRIAGVRGSVVFESAALNALAAFAEAGHGVAVVPATFRRKGERVRIGRLELRRKPVTMPLAILWDSDKPLPRFAEKFPAMFLAHVRALMRDDHNGLDKSQARE